MVIPGLAFASGGPGSGGAGTGPGSPGSSPNPPVPVTAGNVPVTASSDGITITSEASAFMRGGVSVTGTVPASDAGDVVEIDQLGSAATATWAPVADATRRSPAARSRRRGTRQRPGPLTIRAVINGSQASSAAAAPTRVGHASTAARPRRFTAPASTATGPRADRSSGATRSGSPTGRFRAARPSSSITRASVITVPVIDRGPVRPRRQLGPDDGHRSRDRDARRRT